MAWILAALLTVSVVPQTQTIRGKEPEYEITLPEAYASITTPEPRKRYERAAGPEAWAKLRVSLAPAPRPVPQHPEGPKANELRALAEVPENAACDFTRVRWKDLDIGAFEYRAVQRDLQMFGLSAVVPLAEKALVVTVSAPEPLEKEVRMDLAGIVASIQGKSNWYGPDTFETIRRYDLAEKAGLTLIAVYVIAWAVFFRGHPFRAHWLRTGWLVLIGLLLFTPLMSPGDASAIHLLLVNGTVAGLSVAMAIRRVKLAIDLD